MTIKSINPATLEVNAEIEPSPVDSVKNIVDSARDAQILWGGLSLNKRLQHLNKVKDCLISNIDEVAKVITLDNGKPLVEAINSEIYPVLDMFRFCANDAAEALRSERVNNPIFRIARVRSYNLFEPRGVAGIISPWNFPFSIPVTQILMALVGGNAVVFKPSVLTALVGEQIRKLFEEGGMPEGVVNVVQGSGSEIGDVMMDAGFDHVIFTGSIAVGKHLMKKAADTLTPITLELGGKDPFIVFSDADVERASSAAVWGAFINAGQVCASVERVYVDRRVVEDFTSAVVEKTKKLRLGDGIDPDTDMGPLISEERIGVVEAHINDAVSKGARILTGGKRITDLPGFFFEPTVIADANHTMDCMMEETFGPTLPIMVFDDIDEAVELANDTRYGLNASIWTANIKKAEGISRRLRAGTVIVNNCLFTYGFSQCPWGGVKESGIGRTHSVHGLHELTNIKNVTINTPLIREDLWWYPYTENKYKALKGALKAMFGGRMIRSAEGIVEIIKSFRLY
ncbi:MAG: aldehyde dehydrogenase family protein [bacterium]